MTDYYVDATSGSDASNGLSTAAAWKTINKVNGESFSADDFILFKRGETWREQLTVPSSGSDGSPITFGAYGTGNTPILYVQGTGDPWGSVENVTQMAISTPNAVRPLIVESTDRFDGYRYVVNNPEVIDAFFREQLA